MDKGVELWGGKEMNDAVRRHTKIFKEGMRAYANGLVKSQCPYLKKSKEAYTWNNGYYYAKTGKFLNC